MVDAGVGRLVFSSTCAVYGTPDASPVDESARPVRRTRTARASSWSNGWPAGSRPRMGPDGRAALLQRGRRRTRWVQRRGLGPSGEPRPGRAPGRRRATRQGRRLRHRLPDPGRHGDPRLRPRARPGRCACARARSPGRGGSAPRSTSEPDRASRCATSSKPLVRSSGRSIETHESPRRPGDPAAIWADGRDARELLGWAPRYDLGGIVASAWAWHQRHPDGYGPVPAARPRAVA